MSGYLKYPFTACIDCDECKCGEEDDIVGKLENVCFNNNDCWVIKKSKSKAGDQL